MPWATLLTNKWVLAGLAAVAVGVALLWFYYDAKAAGAAAVIAAAATEAARRVAAANKARSEVDHGQDAIRNDPHNRDRRL